RYDYLSHQHTFPTRRSSDLEPVEYVAELKYDGASISILYEHGLLKEAVTRGDGFRGDEITPNVKTISDIPLQIKGDFPDKFYVRDRKSTRLNSSHVKISYAV